jgi:hypothetical protein
MREFRSNEEFLAFLRRANEKWRDQRLLAPLSKILPSYLAFNGLGDGWHGLLTSLRAARGLGYEVFSRAIGMISMILFVRPKELLRSGCLGTMIGLFRDFGYHVGFES